MRLFVSVLLMCMMAVAQTPASEVDVSAGQAQNQGQGQGWTDTGVDLRAGDSLVITAEGTLNLPMGKTCGPGGQNRGFRDLLKAYPVNEAGLGALVGRIGSSDAAQPFLVGASKQMQVPHAGRLFLGINQTKNDAIDGSFHAKVAFSARGPET